MGAQPGRSNEIAERVESASFFNVIQNTEYSFFPAWVVEAIRYSRCKARGDARDDSDWDVLILLDKDRITSQDIDDYAYPLREMGWELGQSINAILYTKRDWGKSIASPLRQNVTEDGKSAKMYKGAFQGYAQGNSFCFGVTTFSMIYAQI